MSTSAPKSTLAWRAVQLPSDPRGRSVLRAVAACAGRWYAAGGLLAPDGTTAPALWSSADGRAFTPMPIKPVSVYGPSDLLSTVACDANAVVAAGAKSGGAHGNPRTSTWVSTRGGPLTEVAAPFEQYGGEAAIGVGEVVGGPAGFVILGARINATAGPGAALWQSTDGIRFTLVDADPALESDPRGRTEVDGAIVGKDGFLAIGAITPTGSHLAARDPLGWRSSDGKTWQRIAFPTSPADDPLQRAAALPDGSALALGTGSTGFTSWRSDPSWSDWHEVATFGATVSGSSVPMVADCAPAGLDGVVFAVVANGLDYQLWRGVNGTEWREFALPESVPAAPVLEGPRVVTIASAAGDLLLGADDGASARLWIADLTG
jgi:hypothetical protein